MGVILEFLINLMMKFLDFLHIEHYDNGNDEAKKIIKKIILILFIVLVIISVIMFIIKWKIENDQKQIECGKLYDKAQEEYQKYNFLEAAKIYDKIPDILAGEKNNVTYLKATCYESYGRSEKKTKYIETAIWLYEDVIKKGKDGSDYYSQALIHVGEIYVYYYDVIYKNRLDKIVQLIEDDEYYAESEEEEIIYYIGQTLVLGKYYSMVYDEDGDIGSLEKAQKNYLQCLKYLKKLYKKDILFESEKEAIENSYLMEIARFIWRYSDLREINEDLLNQAISLYNFILEDIDENDEMYKYIYCKKNIARCYFMLGYTDKSYMKKASVIFKNLLDLSDNDQSDDDLLDIGPFLIATGMYNENDKKKIFNIYESMLKKVNKNKEMEQYLEVHYQNMITCFTIFTKENSLEYLEKGFDSIEELEKYKDFLDETKKEGLKSFKEEYESIKA